MQLCIWVFFLILAECVWTCWTSLEICSLRTYRRRRVHTVLGSSWPPSVSRRGGAPRARCAPTKPGSDLTWQILTTSNNVITGPSQETKETACRFKLQEVHVATCDVSKYLYFFLHDTAKKKSWKVYLILADRWQSSILAVSCGPGFWGTLRWQATIIKSFCCPWYLSTVVTFACQ